MNYIGKALAKVMVDSIIAGTDRTEGKDYICNELVYVEIEIKHKIEEKYKLADICPQYSTEEALQEIFRLENALKMVSTLRAVRAKDGNGPPYFWTKW